MDVIQPALCVNMCTYIYKYICIYFCERVNCRAAVFLKTRCSEFDTATRVIQKAASSRKEKENKRK